MGIYVKTANSVDKVGYSQTGVNGIIRHVGYYILTYKTASLLQYIIPTGVVPTEAFNTNLTLDVLMTLRFYPQMPYTQIKAIGYNTDTSAQTITLQAIGSGFVNGHVQAVSVIVITT